MTLDKDRDQDGQDGSVRKAQWKTIPGFPYKISSTGRVIHLAHRNTRGDRFKDKELSFNPKKRKDTTLYNEFTKRREFIAVLMLEVFIGPRPSKKHVARHLNDKCYDDVLENLAWGTRKDNTLDAIKNGIFGKGSPSSAKISKALKGRQKPPFSEIHRQRIGEANRRRGQHNVV
jgi:hypothetical protein